MNTSDSPDGGHPFACCRRRAQPAPSRFLWAPLGILALLGGCASLEPLPLSEHHLKPSQTPLQEQPPDLASVIPIPPKPTQQNAPQAERYSVVVNKTPVQDILFVIARDAKLNIDIHPGITGYVTMSALDQTLGEILDRISRQVDMRYELEGHNLTVLPDSPFLKHYKVEYPSVKRTAVMSLASTTSVSGSGGGGGSSNGSSASIEDKSSNQFWDTLVSNLKDLLRETDKIIPGSTGSPPIAVPEAPHTPPQAANASKTNVGAMPAAGSPGTSVTNKAAEPPQVMFREAASVIANPEGGVISVRATMKQQQKVREFIDHNMLSVRRQVMIESTIVEVELSDEYKQGINWNLLSQAGKFSLAVGPAGAQMPSGLPVGGVIPSMGLITATSTGIGGSRYDFQTAIRLLESFGRARVLSSPKISALNNQPAVLRVVDNLVYFTLTGTYSPGTNGSPATISVTSTPNTASVGFTMGVTPQISADNEVTLLLRPTISRVISYVDDPAIGVFMSLAKAGGSTLPEVSSRIPQIQTREMESIIKVRGGMTAVLGGLMRDSSNSATDGIPGTNVFGSASELFKYKNRLSSRSELVIFLRPVIVSDASLEGDYAPWRSTLTRATQQPDAGAAKGETSP
ncbi:MAG: type II secretion system protein GspD [Burkholderiales bacterium]|jgi:MSHA biogenesis protein MshL